MQVNTLQGKSWIAQVDKVIWEGVDCIEQIPVTLVAATSLPQIQALDGVCICSRRGVLVGKYAPGMCRICWKRRYGE